MIALRLPSVAAAQAVSRGLYLLSRPALVNGPQDTQFLAAWEVQQDGTALLILDPDCALPVHDRVVAQMLDATDAEGSKGAMAALLGPLLTDAAKGLPAVGALIARGGELRVGDLLPLLKQELIVNPYVPPVRVGP